MSCHTAQTYSQENCKKQVRNFIINDIFSRKVQQLSLKLSKKGGKWGARWACTIYVANMFQYGFFTRLSMKLFTYSLYILSFSSGTKTFSSLRCKKKCASFLKVECSHFVLASAQSTFGALLLLQLAQTVCWETF